MKIVEYIPSNRCRYVEITGQIPEKEMCKNLGKNKCEKCPFNNERSKTLISLIGVIEK